MGCERACLAPVYLSHIGAASGESSEANDSLGDKLRWAPVTRTLPKLALPMILEEDWPQWRAVDKDIPSFEKWIELFDKSLKVAESRGWPYERVAIRPDAFHDWCKSNQRAADKFNRNIYALKMLREGNVKSIEVPNEVTREDTADDPAPELPPQAEAELKADATSIAVEVSVPQKSIEREVSATAA